SPDFHSLSAQPFIWLLVLVIGSAAFSRKPWLFRHTVMIVVFLYMALLAGRNLALFALVAPLPIARAFEGLHIRETLAAYFPKSLGKPLEKPAQDRPVLNWLIVSLVFLGCTYRSFLAWSPQTVATDMKGFYPLGAVEHLKETRPQGRLFNSYNWGAYLLWALPEYPVFVDGRTDLYGDQILEQWLQLVQLREGWEQVIERWQIRVILMEREWVAAKYLTQTGWCLSYQDEVALVLEKCP
ncbi:MAG: hypothetical protein RML93_10745, partial [Anaerolineales bacterium]|nr:hypothetical protein [Anaerolineales bacterium]MDW8447754.1 hypothetical protein [Anaerolineales bacterium]